MAAPASHLDQASMRANAAQHRLRVRLNGLAAGFGLAPINGAPTSPHTYIFPTNR